MKPIAPETFQQAAEAISAGHLVVVPTQRWYMICGDAADPDACARIFTGKRRPTSKPLLLSLPTSADADRLFTLSPDARTLITHFWPGDLALRLPWKTPTQGQRYAAVGTETALVGCSDDPLGLLTRTYGTPIAATSANTSPQNGDIGRGPSLTPREVHDFATETGTEIKLLIDGGICPQNHHMTIVDCPATRPSFLHRSGTVHTRAIESALGCRSPDQARPGPIAGR